MSNIHTRNVVWRCFFANENNFLSSLVPFNSFFCCEDNLTAASSRRCVESRSERLCALQCLAFKLWVQKLVKLVWLYAQESLLFCNHTLADHIYRHLNCSRSCALTVAALKHKELAFLNGELHILHIVIVRFETVADCRDFLEDFWLLLLESRNIHWSADTSNNVFTLSVDEVLSHKVILTC